MLCYIMTISNITSLIYVQESERFMDIDDAVKQLLKRGAEARNVKETNKDDTPHSKYYH